MNSRERFLETLLFGAPDKIPFNPGGFGPRESTLVAWHAQGLKEDVNYMDSICALVDERRRAKGLPPGDYDVHPHALDLGVRLHLMPEFEEQVLSHEDGHYVVRDYMGAVTEISDVYDPSYIREARDFVTRRWHKFPVANHDDWENLKWRFDPATPERLPVDFEERCARFQDRTSPLVFRINGPFWQLREFCGMEGLCVMMYEQPDLVEEMAAFWTEFGAAMLQAVLDRVTPDMLLFPEDMAYKGKPMISPEMARRYCAPSYHRWVEQGRRAGVPLFSVDSDGCIDLLLPLFIECGINCVEPMEVAAGTDLNALRGEYGRTMAFTGGVDKRALAAGPDHIDRELARLLPVIKDGGFIPGCDHGVPPDVSWPDFQYYAVRLAEITGWCERA